MDWINLEVTRPEFATWVLCLCTKGSTWLAFRANGGWYINTNYGQKFIANSDTTKIIELQYWLPIPEIPKELFNKLFPEKHHEEVNEN